MHLQFSTTQSTISSAAFELLCSKRDRYLGLLRRLVGSFDRLENDITTLATQALDSRSTRRRAAGPLPEVFHVPADEIDVLEDAPVPPPSDKFLGVYNELCSCCCLVGCHPSLFFFARLCPSVSILLRTLYRSS